MRFHLPRLDPRRCHNAAEVCAALAIPLCAAPAILFLLNAAFDIGPNLGAPQGRYAHAAQWGR